MWMRKDLHYAKDNIGRVSLKGKFSSGTEF